MGDHTPTSPRCVACFDASFIVVVRSIAVEGSFFQNYALVYLHEGAIRAPRVFRGAVGMSS